jgi:Rod binding domain-containing protein
MNHLSMPSTHSSAFPAIANETNAHERQPRVAKAAREFEASLMKELLQPLQQQDGLFGGEKESDGSNDALSSFASDALAGAISSHGGFGIAKQIVEHLSGTKAT